jgi:PhoPQ-activated pathogenicity-related protein
MEVAHHHLKKKNVDGGVLVKGTSKRGWVLDVMIILCTCYDAFDI